MRKSILVVLCLVLVGCAPSTHFIKDDFDNYTIHRMKGNQLVNSEFWDMYRFDIDLQKFEQEDRISYSLIARHVGTEWLFIEEGETLILLVDGERTGFSGDGSSSHREVTDGGRVEEKAWYNISPGQIKQIIEAKEVRVKLKGKTWNREGIFRPSGIQAFRTFYTEYIAMTGNE